MAPFLVLVSGLSAALELLLDIFLMVVFDSLDRLCLEVFFLDSAMVFGQRYLKRHNKCTNIKLLSQQRGIGEVEDKEFRIL